MNSNNIWKNKFHTYIFVLLFTAQISLTFANFTNNLQKNNTFIAKYQL